MRILLTNDDGIHAEGLVALENIARRLSDDVFICAPEYEQSGASRALTLSEPIRVRKLDARRYATTGTPTDCVMLAVTELMAGQRPDLVLSGVNRGANLAEDVTQGVFVLLGRKRPVVGEGKLAGWLFNTTRFVARNAVKMEMRRRKHERAAAGMRGEVAAGQDEARWEDVGPLLDGVVEIARARKLKIAPLCSYAAAYMRRHPELGDLLA